MADDIKKGWNNVTRRLQSVAGSGQTSIVSINVVVGADGEPMAWTEPKVTRMEPRSKAEAVRVLCETCHDD